MACATSLARISLHTLHTRAILRDESNRDETEKRRLAWGSPFRLPSDEDGIRR